MDKVCLTEKMCFDTKQDALTWGRSVKLRKKEKDQVKAYKCTQCNYWHLTTATTMKYKQRCQRFAVDSAEKYKGNLKPYMFNK